MFTVHCSRHGSQMLLGPRRIRRLENTSDGVVVHWRCYCGHEGRLVTGQYARRGERLPA